MPELLNAFDIIVSTNDHCRFGDVATLQSASEFIADGHEVSSVVRLLLRAKEVYNRARVLEMSEGLVGAEEDLQTALQRDERYLDAIFNLSQIKLKQGDAPQAVSLLDQFLELSPENEWTVVARKTRKLALADAGQKF